MLSVERCYLYEDIRKCYYCKQYIESKKYIIVNNKFYFHKCCYEQLFFIQELKNKGIINGLY